MIAKAPKEQRLVWDPAQKIYLAAGNPSEVEGPQQRESTTIRPAPSSRFLRGPVPWPWVIRAASLPGKALIVGLCLWRLRGAKNSDSVMLANSELRPFGIGRAAKSRAITALEKAGLISVKRCPGRFPIVTLLGTSDEQHAVP